MLRDLNVKMRNETGHLCARVCVRVRSEINARRASKTEDDIKSNSSGWIWVREVTKKEHGRRVILRVVWCSGFVERLELEVCGFWVGLWRSWVATESRMVVVWFGRGGAGVVAWWRGERGVCVRHAPEGGWSCL